MSDWYELIVLGRLTNDHTHRGKTHFRFGIYSIDLSINAGLDLEMPGTNKWRTLDLMNRSIGSRKLTVRTIKERAKKVVELAKRVAQEAPEVIASNVNHF
jgi:hypothetical protein